MHVCPEAYTQIIGVSYDISSADKPAKIKKKHINKFPSIKVFVTREEM